MRRIAEGVWQLISYPLHYINVYLVNDTLIDAAMRYYTRAILSQLGNRRVRMVALTHCHPDHQGCAKNLCEHFGVPLACHELDTPAMEGREPMLPRNRLLDWAKFMAGPPHPVARVLRAGDEVAGFRVVHAPGHTPGHIFYFRPQDRLVIAGDILANLNFFTGRPRLREPPWFFSADPLQNRRSLKILLDLNPNAICFGHGPPLYDMDKLRRFIHVRLRWLEERQRRQGDKEMGRQGEEQ